MLFQVSSDVFQKDIEEEYSLRPPTATELLKKNGLIYREAVASDARISDNGAYLILAVFMKLVV